MLCIETKDKNKAIQFLPSLVNKTMSKTSNNKIKNIES